MPRALAELFRDWRPDSLDTPPELEAVFSSGHSNRSFLVRLGRRSVVVRLPEGNGERLGIDRQSRIVLRTLELGPSRQEQLMVVADGPADSESPPRSKNESSTPTAVGARPNTSA